MVLLYLRKYREAKEWTPEKLACESNMTVRNVAYIESGKGTTLNTAKRLAKALKCKVADLQGEP